MSWHNLGLNIKRVIQSGEIVLMYAKWQACAPQ